MVDSMTRIEQTGPSSWKLYSNDSLAFCSLCREEVVWVTPTVADAILTIDRHVLVPTVHARRKGHVMTFCLNSLSFVADPVF